MKVITIKELLEQVKDLEERCRQKQARIVLLENALITMKLKYPHDEELKKLHFELINDDYRPDQIDLTKSRAVSVERPDVN